MESLTEDFSSRIKHDFKNYILITSICIHNSEDETLQMLYEIDGYVRHKTVKYGFCTSHIVVKFKDEHFASEAIGRLNMWTKGLKVALVDDMLRDWFTYESKTCRGPRFSLAIVDVIGSPPLNLNFLTSSILSPILEDFGAPYLLPYTAALYEPHVQVLFASMTEALAACIAFGEWRHIKDKTDCFYYRVRINPSNKEENLIKICGGTPSEAFKLDYFMELKKELKTEKGKDSTAKDKRPKTKTPLNKGVKNLLKQKYSHFRNSEVQQMNTFCNGTPILYFPIIATNGYNGHQSPNNQLGTDFTTVLMNWQTFSTQAVSAITVQDVENSAMRLRNTGEIPVYVESKVKQSNILQNNCKQNLDTCVLKSTQSFHRRATRIFERRR